MFKKTRLGDDATIYSLNNNQTDKEKLKDLPWNKKIAYLWDYYKYHALISIVIILVVIYSIYTFTKPKIDTKLYTAIINNTVEPQIWDDYQVKITEYLELDTTSENAKLNYSFYFNGAPDYEVNMRQALTAYVVSTDIDIIIAPLSEFSDYVNSDFFVPLSDHLPTDLYSTLTDQFYLSGTDDNPKVAAYGIYLDQTKLYKNHSLPTDEDPVIMGIVANSTNKENAVRFIRYLYSE